MVDVWELESRAALDELLTAVAIRPDLTPAVEMQPAIYMDEPGSWSRSRSQQILDTLRGQAA